LTRRSGWVNVSRGRESVPVKRLALLAVATLALGACGGGDGEEAQEATATEPPATTDRPATTSRRPESVTPAPTARELVDEWFQIAGTEGRRPLLVRFTADGRFAIAQDDPNLDADPAASGTYELVGRRLTLTNTRATPFCHDDEQLIWEVGLNADDELEVEWVKLCNAQGPTARRWLLTRRLTS